MGKDYSHKIKKLYVIADWAIKYFLITGVFSVTFMLLGGIIAAIVAGVIDYDGIIRFVIAAFFFGVAVTTLFWDLCIVSLIWVTVIRRIAGTMQLRRFISTIIGYGFALPIPTYVGFVAIKLGISYLVDPTILNSIT
jgi:hypothetical protein